MFDRYNGVIRGVLRTSRWSMAPLALGLAVALALVLVQFFRELWHTMSAFAAMSDGDVMIGVLKLVDLVLIANLLIMIVGAAVDMLAPRRGVQPDELPEHSDEVAFGLIKLKLFASISAIAAIYLLERFISTHPVDKTEVLWEILILLTFVASGVLLAWMDRLTEDRH